MQKSPAPLQSRFLGADSPSTAGSCAYRISKRISITVIPFCEIKQDCSSRIHCDLRHTLDVFGCIVSLKRMKKFFQIVSVVAIALLTSQPAIAGLTCGLVPPASLPGAPHCPLSMSHSGLNCQVPLQASRTGCRQESCRFGWPQAVVRSISGAKHKAIPGPLFQASPAATPVNRTALSAPPPGDLAAASPPRRILLCVFRI